MKHKLFKMTTTALAVIIILTTMALPASAETTTSIYGTTTGKAGTWKTEAAHSLTSPTLDSLCGGDVGVWFYSGATGLQASFYHEPGRTVSIFLLEKDDDGVYTAARAYTGYFYVDAYGEYVMQRVAENGATSNVIENDSTAELCIRYKVNTHSKDTSTSLPANLMKYCFWVY